jgi:hypothetical protein
MTPEEFAAHAEAFRRREEREWWRAAWQVSGVIGPHVKKQLKPADLLGWKPRRRVGQARTTEDSE